MSTEVKPTDWDAEDNRWEPTPSGGGGGSSLPSYTSADKGKVLTIGEGEGSVTTVIVPEQTVTIVDEEAGAALTVDYADVEVGMPAVITINGVETETVGDYGDVEPEVAFNSDSETLIVNPSNATAVFYAAAGTYTVSLTASAPVAEVKWEKPSEGAETLVIKATSVHEVQGNTTVLATDVTVDDYLAAFTGDGYTPVYAVFPQVLNGEISYDTVTRSMLVKATNYSEDEDNVSFTVRYISAQNAVFMLITSNVS